MTTNSMILKREDRIGNYLAALSNIGNKTTAAKKSKVPASTLTSWRREVPAFRDREAHAMEEFRGMLIDVAVERALHGWEKPVIHQGDYQYMKDPESRELMIHPETGDFIKVTQTQMNDQLLIKLLEANVPQFNKNPQMLIGIGSMDDEAPTIRVLFGTGDDAVPLGKIDDTDAVDAKFEEVEEPEEDGTDEERPDEEQEEQEEIDIFA